MNRSALLLLMLMLAALPLGALSAADDDASLPSGTKRAKAGGITVSVASRVLFPRPQAPLPISITLACDEGTRTGRLRLTLGDSHETLYTWTSGELTVTGLARTVDALLPTLPVQDDHLELSARIAWLEGRSPIQFEPLPLVIQGREQRPLTVALCTGPGGDPRGAMRVATLERFLAPPPGGDWRPDAHQVMARLAEADLPTHALGWCAYDEAVLAGDGFARLKARQLTALARWVRAGGAACVLVEGQLGEDQLAFLRGVAEGDGATLAAGPAGLDASARWPLLMRSGLGRVGVAPLGAALDPAREAEFRGIAPFLWRLRAEPAARAQAGSSCDFTALGKLDAETRESALQNPYAYSSNARNGKPKAEDKPSFREVPLPLTSTFTNLLVPARVSIIPFGMVFLVFLAFVLAVGPGDWFVLGALRARRFTWIVFPLVAIAFTVLMVRLSRHYLGASDHRDRLTVVDCGHGGEVLRANALELVFTGERAEVESQLSDALWSDVGRGETEDYRYGYNQQVGERRDAPPEYEGSLPGKYRVSQGIGQWDPRLRRELSLEAPADLPLRLDRDLRYDQRQDYAAELARLHEKDGPFYIGCFRGGSREDLYGTVNSLSVRAAETVAWRYGGQSRDWLSWLCAHPSCGWFTLVTQVSPCGGATWEDWAVHDPGDRREWLLVAAQRRGDALWVVRRIYRDRSPSDPADR